MDKLKAMEAFVRVVDTGGFTRAAERMGAPKASVSTLVAELEAQLGVRLLHRTTRKVTVTADGAAYYERCVRLIDDLREADEAVSSRQGQASGRLRVDVSTSLGSLLMYAGIGEFMARYPDIQLEIGCSDRLVNLVSEAVDCVLRIGEVSDPGTVARRVGSMRLLTCASKGYVQAHGLPQHPHELSLHKWIGYFPSQTPGRIFPAIFQRDGERIEWTPTCALSVNDSNVYEDALHAGLGIGMLPSYVLGCEEKAKGLVEVLPDWASDPIPIFVMYPSNRHLSTRVQAFGEWVAELCERHPSLRRD
jgi:LysR family transcriptional regulator, regulator for bpeEF and oprC